MKVILFGATGMVGQGVLRECLLDAGVESVLASAQPDWPTARQAARNPARRFYGFFEHRVPTHRDTTPASSASASPRSG